MKRLLKVLWKSTWPLRRPFQRRAEAFLPRLPFPGAGEERPSSRTDREVTLVLDAVLAEQFRLRADRGDPSDPGRPRPPAPVRTSRFDTPHPHASSPTPEARCLGLRSCPRIPSDRPGRLIRDSGVVIPLRSIWDCRCSRPGPPRRSLCYHGAGPVGRSTELGRSVAGGGGASCGALASPGYCPSWRRSP